MFVEGCDDIYHAKPMYKNGASDLAECDCIGMDKYSFRKNGVKFSTTGTNWSFRNQVDNIRELKSADQLQVGDVVFKAYAPGETGYNLPAKYQQGGSAYNGDLNDYYHIGTVKSVNPLQIIHMTSPTAKMDTTLKNKGWDYAAQWKKDYISDYSPEPQPEPQPGPEPGPGPNPGPNPNPITDEPEKLLKQWVPDDIMQAPVNTPVAFAADLDDDETDKAVRKNVDGSVTVVRAIAVGK
jgi:hypothetical protein